MTTKNKDLFVQDPTQTKIPNDGVSKVLRPETDDQWSVLEWELKSFVCEGEYHRGLDRILTSFLTNLGQNQQPAVWVSGFYGSGKSHMCRVLEYLWRDITLPSGETARSLTNLPADVDSQLRELSIAGKRLGGLWSATGTLGAGKSQAVRLAFLSVLFDAAGLPQQYPLARFTIWARENGYLEGIEAAVEAAGKTFDDEVNNLYVSPIIAKALLEADPTLGDSVKDVRSLLQAQFPARTEDVTDEEMFEAIEDVLRLKSDKDGKYPLTLIVLDEMQQYLGDDNTKTLAVQNIVEGVTSKFDNCVLFLTTGQSAMGGTPTLEKLTDRFPVHVHLSDKDVETVVRQVILRKKETMRDELSSVLDKASGEIDRHLGGTKIAPTAADKQDLVADYPLLPTRRRFWELALKALDRAGKSGVLRTQLRIVHEATREVAELPVGHVVGADFLYHQQADTLRQSGELLKEISESILELKDDGPDGELKSRICALVYIINEIPTQMMGIGDTGLRATAPFIADLLVEDLQDGAAQVRKRIPELLQELAETSKLQQLGEEYRIQTEVGAEWDRDYRTRLKAIRDDAGKLATLRNERLLAAVDTAVSGLRLTHGTAKTPRKITVHYGPDEPATGGTDIPVWIRDEWAASESAVKNAAVQAGEEDPVIHVLLPKLEAEQIKDALASFAAAQETVQAKPTPQTPEGEQAKQAMTGRMNADGDRLKRLLDDVVSKATVYQGGGNVVEALTLRDAIEVAADRSLVRLFPKFNVADNPKWGAVVTKARDGAPDALKEIGHQGEPTTQAVCKEVLASISSAGIKGSDIRAKFEAPPFGWDEDAIRGAIMALLAAGNIRAAQDGTNLTSAKQLEPRQIGKTTFYEEDPPPTMGQRLAVRNLLSTADIPYENNQEGAQIPALLQKFLDLAADAGGMAPLPERPDTAHVKELQEHAGNEQFKKVADHPDLKDQLSAWKTAAKQREERLKSWGTFEALLHHARDLDIFAEATAQGEAVRSGRQLLAEPDPIRPLIDMLAGPLREAIKAAHEQLKTHHANALAELEASEEWDKLSNEDWKKIFDEVAFQPPADIDVSTLPKLVEVLADTPLSGWQDKTEVIRARAARARELAAKKLEPAAVTVRLASATLRDASDLDAYVDDLRTQVLKHIEDGNTVII